MEFLRTTTIPRCAIPPFFSFIGSLPRLLAPSSVRSIVEESLLNDQLLNVNHFRQSCMKERPGKPISLFFKSPLFC
jgi:hypothetical protein